MSYQLLVIGVDDFEKIITKDYYYVDKTLLIKELLDKKGEVNFFTRPRRFGKTPWSVINHMQDIITNPAVCRNNWNI